MEFLMSDSDMSWMGKRGEIKWDEEEEEDEAAVIMVLYVMQNSKPYPSDHIIKSVALGI